MRCSVSGWRREVWIALGICALAAVAIAAPEAPEGQEDERPELDVPYVPTQDTAVEAMLELANVGAADYVIDLGCGDGRIVIAAAKKYKAKGFGVDLDPQRIRESNENATKAGVVDRVTFQKGDIMDADIHEATVVTLFLLESVNVQLRPKLFAELKPGTRVVSNSFTMRDWKPDKTIRHQKAYSKKILFWSIPAPVGGTWTWQASPGGKQMTGSLKLQQEFQAVQGKLACGGAAEAAIAEAKLGGKDLQFTAPVRVGDQEVTATFRGTAEGDAIQGTMELPAGPNAGSCPWTASRKPVDLTGSWQVRAASDADQNGTLHIRAKDGRLAAVYVRDKEPNGELPLSAFYVWGSSVRFEVPTNSDPEVFSGSLGPDGGGGRLSREGSKDQSAWSAKPLAAKAG